MSTPKFAVTAQSFHTELKRRVNSYFEEQKKKTTGNFNLYFKAIAFGVALIGVYVHLVFFTPVLWLGIVESLVLGGLIAAIGFNVMHD